MGSILRPTGRGELMIMLITLEPYYRTLLRASRYGKNLAIRRPKRNVLFDSVLYSTLIEKKSFVSNLFPVPANLHI